MKKLLFFIGLALLFSCEKEPRYCWQCNKEIFADNAYASHVDITCDKTESDIRAYEDDESSSTDRTAVIMSCIKYE